MIKIKVLNHNDVCEIELKGHADFKLGNDIVCSAVSCLTCVFLEKLAEKGNIKEQKVLAGDTSFKYIKTGAENYTDFYITGLKMIEEQYPDNVSIMVGAR